MIWATGSRLVSTLVLLSVAFEVSAAPGAAKRAIPDWKAPLSTRGRYVVDADGNRFKLKSGNWHGGSGTYNGSGDVNDDNNHHAGENSHNIPLGLDRVPIGDILTNFEDIGINSIRLQWSNEMIHDTNIVPDIAVTANPQFKGMTPLQIYDQVVQALTDRKFAVIINNHTNKERWCCGVGDGSERWNESQSNDQWADDWLSMVRRYKDNKRVVGADLYNEVRRDILTDPNWGGGDNADWYDASHWVADRILFEANPDLLIIVEGINWTGIPVDGFPHGRPTLTPVSGLSHSLVQSHKLVYSAHFYSYTGPNHSGATGIGETSDPRYQDLSPTDLFNVMHDSATYAAETADQHFTAPVWLSEFGIGRFEPPGKGQDWFNNFIEFATSRDIDFAVWPLVGFQENGASANGWGLLNWSKAGQRLGLSDGTDWRAPGWAKLVGSNGKQGQVDKVPTWKMLNMDFHDATQSVVVKQNRGDWDNGARKAVCPDGLRLIGMDHNSQRGLCTDVQLDNMWNLDNNGIEVVWTEQYVDNDWASGYTKYQCPAGSYVIGFAVRDTKLSTVMCAKASRSLGTSGRTIWFDRSDNRATQQGGDFANGAYKGQCGNGEYISGVAFTTRIGAAVTTSSVESIVEGAAAPAANLTTADFPFTSDGIIWTNYHGTPPLAATLASPATSTAKRFVASPNAVVPRAAEAQAIGHYGAPAALYCRTA